MLLAAVGIHFSQTINAVCRVFDMNGSFRRRDLINLQANLASVCRAIFSPWISEEFFFHLQPSRYMLRIQMNTSAIFPVFLLLLLFFVLFMFSVVCIERTSAMSIHRLWMNGWETVRAMHVLFNSTHQCFTINCEYISAFGVHIIS